MTQEEIVRSILTSEDVSSLPVHERVGFVIEARDVDTAISKIRQAEQAGVQQVWMTQSVGMMDTLTLFAAAATHTTRVRFGTAIVPIYPRHPLVMAQQAVTVDALAPGRLRLGCWHQPSPGDGKHIWLLDVISSGVPARICRGNAAGIMGRTS